VSLLFRPSRDQFLCRFPRPKPVLDVALIHLSLSIAVLSSTNPSAAWSDPISCPCLLCGDGRPLRPLVSRPVRLQEEARLDLSTTARLLWTVSATCSARPDQLCLIQLCPLNALRQDAPPRPPSPPRRPGSPTSLGRRGRHQHPLQHAPTKHRAVQATPAQLSRPKRARCAVPRVRYPRRKRFQHWCAPCPSTR
jgi:hypothetical protein